VALSLRSRLGSCWPVSLLYFVAVQPRDYCGDVTITPRMMTIADVEWVVELAARRRQRIAKFAPRLWNPAPGARREHATFLAGLIQSSTVLSVRTDHGYLFGVPDRGRVVVDDLGLEDDALWQSEGNALLRHAAGSGPLRVVCPIPEAPRRAVVADLALSVAETWWHRDLDLVPPFIEQRDEHRLAVEGAEGLLVSAPPVYDPGGPVLLVQAAATESALRSIERSASQLGAVVSVVSVTRGSQLAPADLEASGYKETTEFFEGSIDPQPSDPPEPGTG
jgi:hypothetical protein